MSDARQLPARSRVLPCAIPFRIPGFLRCYHPSSLTFAPGEIPSETWYDDFTERVLQSLGKIYLPICRLSDGEFAVLLGERWWRPGLPLGRQLRRVAGVASRRLLGRRFNPGGVIGQVGTPEARWGYVSGSYGHREIGRLREAYGDALCRLAEKGVLALHLSYGAVPFQEHYFSPLKAWLARRHLVLTFQNYAPFYFVYALLTGPRRVALLRDRRVLLVTHADHEKRDRVEASLRREGVRDIHWCPVSAARSFFDTIDTTPWRGRVDLAIVAAGVGKPNVLLQLEPLGVPAIDAGFVFEVWANPELRWHRPICVPDDEYDPAKVRFLPPAPAEDP